MFSHRVFLCSDSIRQHEFHIYKIFEHCLLFHISLASISVSAIDEFSEFTVRNTIWWLKSTVRMDGDACGDRLCYWKLKIELGLCTDCRCVLKMAAQYLCESIWCNLPRTAEGRVV